MIRIGEEMKDKRRRTHNTNLNVIPYPRGFKNHVIELYAQYQSSPQVREVISKEYKQGKWGSDVRIPSPATILKWAENADPNIITTQSITDPIKLADLEILNLVHQIVKQARKQLKDMKFRRMAEVIFAITASQKIRKEIRAAYKNDDADELFNATTKTEAIKEKIREEIKKISSSDKALNKQLRLNALDFLKGKERLDQKKRLA